MKTIRFLENKTVQSKPKMKAQRTDVIDDTETCFISITGMTCASCVDSIQRNLAKVTGE
jgi:hypothetical protein